MTFSEYLEKHEFSIWKNDIEQAIFIKNNNESLSDYPEITDFIDEIEKLALERKNSKDYDRVLNTRKDKDYKEKLTQFLIANEILIEGVNYV